VRRACGRKTWRSAQIWSGITPAVATELTHATAYRAVLAAWLMFAAACSLLATMLARRKTTETEAAASAAAAR